MNISFAIHGTPGKSECWGMPNDETYLKSFYDEANNAPEQTRLDIDFRVVDNEVCSYYHYLKLKNISNGIARSGGYFGMSIRFEGAYCLDISNLFKMMNQLYEQVVCKSIIKIEGVNSEYTFSTFKECLAELENIKTLASKALEKFQNDIREFPQNYSPRHGNNIRKYNIADTGSESFHKDLLKNAEVYVSPEYDLLSSKMNSLEKDNIEKIGQIREQQSTITKQSGEIKSLNSTITTQNQTIENQGVQIEEQAREIGHKNSEINKLKGDLGNAEQTIGQLSAKVVGLEKKLKDALSNNDMHEINQCITMLNAILANRKISVEAISSIQSEQKLLVRGIYDAQSKVNSIQNEFQKLKDPKIIGKEGNPTGNEEEPNGDNARLISDWKIPASIIGAIGVLALLYYLAFGKSTTEIKDNGVVSEVTKNEFVTFKQSTEDKLKQMDIKLSSVLNGGLIQRQPATEFVPKETAQPDVTWINLKNYSSVSPGKSYTLEAQTGEPRNRTTINAGGQFYCSQATISDDDGSRCKITINSNAQNSIVVTYKVNGKEVIRRTIEIK